MTYQTRFVAQWSAKNNGPTYNIDIQDADGWDTVEIVTIQVADMSPMSLKMPSSDEDIPGAINHTEIEFRFYTSSNDFEDIYTARQKKFKVIVTKDSGDVIFEGYMKPDSTHRPFIRGPYPYSNDVFIISITATCGLDNLKNYKFADGDTPYTDTVTMTEIIKRCLTPIGLDIGFTLKTSIYEYNLILEDEIFLQFAELSCLRFSKTDKGILEPLSCEEVLRQVLTLGDCSIRQANGSWYVFGNSQIDVLVINYLTWGLAGSSGPGTIPPVLIDESFNFRSRGDLSFRPPLSAVIINQERKYVATSLVLNGDFSDGITGWTNGAGVNAFDYFQALTPELYLRETGQLLNDKTATSDPFSVTQLDPEDKINFSCRFKCIDYTFIGAELDEPPPAFQVTLESPSGSVTLYMGFASAEWQEFTSDTVSLFKGTGTENYEVIFTLLADSAYEQVIFIIDDVNFSVNYVDSENALTDRRITITNTDTIDRNVFEIDTRVGDGVSLNDLGAITVGGVLAKEWCMNGSNPRIPLLELVAAFVLNRRKAFTEFIQATLDDPTDLIYPRDIIRIGSKYYRIVRYSKEFGEITVDLDLLEMKVINTALTTYTKKIEYPSSVDGKAV